MIQLKPEQIEEFKQIYKVEYQQDLTDVEASDAAHRLARFFEILYECEVRELQRQDRLKREPKGFHLEEGGTYTCCICHDSISGQQTWYDQSGIKCLICQRAVDRRVIPRSVCTDRDSWMPSWRITGDLGIHSSTIRKYVRQGELKARSILNDNGTNHYQVFLIKENQEFFKKHQPPQG